MRATVWMAAVLTSGCLSTHQLGKVSPVTVAALNDAGEETGAYVQVQPVPNERSFPIVHPIREISMAGVTLDESGPPVVVPFERVGYICTYDHGRGAVRGAVIGGIIGLVLSGLLVGYVARQDAIAASDGGGAPPASGVVLLIGVGAGIGALIGAGAGGIVGFEERYVVMH
jgi:hypothetical protein